MHTDDLILVSVDDHVVEPPDMFDGHIPAKYRDRAPKVVTKPDGSGAHQIAADLVYPSWYPDGTLAATGTKTQTIQRMDIQAGNTASLTERGTVLPNEWV